MAWQSLIVSHNPDFAFPQKAREVLGAGAIALSEEATFEVRGTKWQHQLWSDGVEVKLLLTIHGQWDPADIQVVELPAVERTEPPSDLFHP